MSRFLYEKSISYRGYLIVPFIFGRANSSFIFSYGLLAQSGFQGKFHRAKNPAKLYSSNLGSIISIAKQHLDDFYQGINCVDYFKARYVYQKNLIVVHEEKGKCFYDHYPPHELRNIAAPKIFSTVSECINWVKKGLDRQNYRKSFSVGNS